MAVTDPFNGFSGSVYSGALTIKVDKGALAKAAGHASDAEFAIQTVISRWQNYGSGIEAPPYTGFGELKSGKAMTDLFVKLQNSLLDELRTQVNVLNEIGYAFMHAAQTYDASEEETRAAFNDLSSHNSIPDWEKNSAPNPLDDLKITAEATRTGSTSVSVHQRL